MRGVFTFEFWRDKYGPELLIDVMTLEEMPGYAADGFTHRLLYHEILFVEQGGGGLWIDDRESPVRPGMVVFTEQGSIRRWRLDGAVQATALFFTPEFLSETLADTNFIEALSFFGSGPNHLELETADFLRFVGDLRAMKAELPDLRRDSSKVLQAELYRLLVRLDRHYEAAHGRQPGTRASEHIARFRREIEEGFGRRLGVAEYAAQLGITPGHLNDLCTERTGLSASGMIQRRVLAEARRLLAHTDLSVGEIGRRLGFDDPSHFGRYFRRAAGCSPREFRARLGPHP